MNFLRKYFEKYRLTDRQVMRCQFGSRDEDGSHHLIRRSRKPHATCTVHLMALSCTEPELWAIKVYIAGIGILIFWLL